MMLALEMFRSLPRTVAGKAMGSRMPGLLSGYAAPLRLVTIDPPKADRPGWARVRTRLSGICGSDLGALSGKTSLYFSAARVAAVRARPRGRRRAPGRLRGPAGRHPGRARPGARPVPPAAWSRARTAPPAPPTGAAGSPSATCRPGLQTGFCKDTGGGWGQQLSAHRSQMHVVPEGYSDEQALLVEPVACAVHTALRAGVRPNDRVLVSGAGSVGLFATLALRELTPAGEIIVVAKHGHQRELALELGATEVVAPDEVLRRVRRSTGAFQLKPEFSSPYLLGGVDVAVDAVGSKQSLETALHATRAGGRVVMSGMPAPADLSAAWFRELELVGTYASRARSPGPTASRLEVASSWSRTTRVAADRQVRRQLSAAPLAGGPRPRALAPAVSVPSRSRSTQGVHSESPP